MAEPKPVKRGSKEVTTDDIQFLSQQITKWKDVARCLGFDSAEIYRIDEDNQDHKEKVYQMIQSWTQKAGTKATIDVLAAALTSESVGRKDLAEKLFKGQHLCIRPSPTGVDAHSDVDSGNLDDLVRCLRETYAAWFSRMRPVPWRRDRKLSIEEVFVDVSISRLNQKEDSLCRESWLDLGNYQALFTDEHLAKATRIIIEADPGCGKTTLMLYLAYLWCSKRFPMNEIDLFIFLPMRSLKPGLSIYKGIFDFLLPKDENMTTQGIQSVLQRKCRKVLALDGVDEFRSKTDGSLQNEDFFRILRNEMLRDVVLILTTRPSGVRDTHDHKIERLRLKGFDHKEWVAYIWRVFKGDAKIMYHNFQKKILENEVLRILCKIPLFFTLIAHIVRDDIKKAEVDNLRTANDVFKCIMTCMSAHLENKSVNLASCSNKQSLIDEQAFQGLLEGSKKLSWNKNELDKDPAYQKLVDSGVLVEEEGLVVPCGSLASTRPTISVRFIHKLFQEWHGANHLEKLAADDERFQIEKMKINIIDLRYLLQFTCGRGAKPGKLVLNYLLHDLPTTLTSTSHHYHRHSDVMFHCLEECMSVKDNAMTEFPDLMERLCQRPIEFGTSSVTSRAKVQFIKYAARKKVTV